MGRRILLLVSLLFAGVPLASLAAAPAPAAGSAPSVLAYLKQQGLKINSRFTAMGGLTGYAGTTPDGSPVIFYVPADGSVAIFGHLIDAYGHDMTQAYGRRFIQGPANQKVFPKLAGQHWIAVGDPHPRRVVYAFIDPNCPYCWEFWQAARGVPGVQVRYLIVAILGDSSVGKAGAILAAKDRGQALDENERGFQHHEGAIEPLKSVPAPVTRELAANLALMQEFGLDGTPGLVWKSESGEVETSNGLPGGDQLRSMFGLPPKPAEPAGSR